MKRKKDQMALHLMMLPGMILLAIFSWEYPKVCVNLQTDVR